MASAAPLGLLFPASWLSLSSSLLPVFGLLQLCQSPTVPDLHVWYFGVIAVSVQLVVNRC